MRRCPPQLQTVALQKPDLAAAHFPHRAFFIDGSLSGTALHRARPSIASGPPPRHFARRPGDNLPVKAFIFPMASGHINPSFPVARELISSGHKALCLCDRDRRRIDVDFSTSG